jgi:hypothetical protein
MNWFLSKLVFQVFCGSGDHAPQFDEQLRLIYAEDELHAFHKARLLGEGDCLTDESIPCLAVKWKFIDVTELYPLHHTTEGAEISSTIKEESEKAGMLLQKGLQEFTT